MTIVIILIALRVLLLLVPMALLWGLFLLVREYGKWRDRLAKAFLALAAVAALLFPGNWLLGKLGFAWRVGAVQVLGAALCIGIVAALVCLDGCLIMGPLSKRKIRQVIVMALSALMSLAVLFEGLIYFGSSLDRERVIGHDGEKIVEVENDLKDARFHYYRCYGPALRGSEPLHWAAYDDQRWKDETTP